MTHADDHPNPDAGFTLTHLGYGLYWQRNEAGGRTYHSDEIPCGVFVWDTCLIDIGTLCEAISMEFALLGAERRAEQRAAFVKSSESGHAVVREGVAVFDGDTLPSELRDRLQSKLQASAPPPAPRVQPVALMHVRQLIEQLRRAHKQLLRYAPEDPVAREIADLLNNGPQRPE